MAENEALSLDHGRAKAMLEEESRKNDDLIAKAAHSRPKNKTMLN